MSDYDLVKLLHRCLRRLPIYPLQAFSLDISGDEPHYIFFSDKVETRFVKVVIRQYESAPCMRLDIIGCLRGNRNMRFTYIPRTCSTDITWYFMANKGRCIVAVFYQTCFADLRLPDPVPFIAAEDYPLGKNAKYETFCS